MSEAPQRPELTPEEKAEIAAAWEGFRAAATRMIFLDLDWTLDLLRGAAWALAMVARGKERERDEIHRRPN